MKKINLFTILLTSISLITLTHQKKLLKFDLREKPKMTQEERLIKGAARASKMRKNGVFSHSAHDGIYALALAQDSANITFLANLTLGEENSVTLEFMIDTGNIFIFINKIFLLKNLKLF